MSFLTNLFSRTAYQSLHKVSNQARHYNYIVNNGVTHSWLEYYRNVHIRSNQIYINEWNQMDDLVSHRSDSPHLYQPYITFYFLKYEKTKISIIDYHLKKNHFVLDYKLN